VNLAPVSNTLAEKVLAGDRLSLARLITQVENGTAAGQAALDELFPHTGRAHLIGVTGSPGTGKSSLVNQLAHTYRRSSNGRMPLRVAVVAVDPSSPFTGGAVLGDRVRMRDLVGDPGVFVRSMAARGTLGGLSRTTAAVVQVLDAAGFDVIFIETVGAGQSEVDIARLAHTTLVIEAPGLGDDIQAIKAGILEIADILVINKADRPGVENTERALRSMLELAHPERQKTPPTHTPEKIKDPCEDTELPCWETPIYLTIAPQASGISELSKAILAHRDYLRQSGQWQAREQSRLQAEMTALLQGTLMAQWREQTPESHYQNVLSKVLERKLSPYQAVVELTNNKI
jgi:LAO/AO transport system kinase